MTLNIPENSKAVSGAHLASVGKEEEIRHVDALELKVNLAESPAKLPPPAEHACPEVR